MFDTDREILTYTYFEKSNHDGYWYWHTEAKNHEIVGDGAEGYADFTDCLKGFFIQQGVDINNAQMKSDYSSIDNLTKTKYAVYKYAPRKEKEEKES